MPNDKQRKRANNSQSITSDNIVSAEESNGSPNKKSDSTSDETVYLEDLESTGEGEGEHVPFVVKKKQKTNPTLPAGINSRSEALKGFDEKTMERVEAFSSYSKEAVNTYAFDKLPAAREWGVNRPIDDKSMVLCRPGTNEPFIIWFVARISRTWFFDRESNPAAQVALNFVPVNDSTGTAARHLLCTLSKPAIVSTMDGWGDLRATKWQNTRDTGGSNSSNKPFTASYDAHMVFRAKKDMEHYAPDLLRPKDLIMAEVMISRYKIFNNNEKDNAQSTSKFKAKSHNWEKWRAHFKLKAVSLISKAPKEEPEDDSTDLTI